MVDEELLPLALRLDARVPLRAPTDNRRVALLDIRTRPRRGVRTGKPKVVLLDDLVVWLRVVVVHDYQDSAAG